MSNQRISVELRRSRRLTLILLATHIAGAIVVVLILPPGWVLVVGLSAVAGSMVWLFSYGLHRVSASTFDIAADGICHWRQRGGVFAGRLRADSTLMPWLVVLRIDIAGQLQARSLVLCADSMNRADWRRLRVFLRWGVRFDRAATARSGEPY